VCRNFDENRNEGKKRVGEALKQRNPTNRELAGACAIDWTRA
jgi:hypothetical protein